jgi:hypothetical protein
MPVGYLAVTLLLSEDQQTTLENKNLLSKTQK